MAISNEKPWIEAGYEVFALHGPDALRVEQLARQVGISKSSFYHHFADLPVFIERLFDHHRSRSVVIAEKAALCKRFDPDVIHLLAAHRLDLLFQRQLRSRRDQAEFQRCFRQAHGTVSNVFMPLWAEALGIPRQLGAASEMFDVVTDVFYQRLTNDNLSYAFIIGLLKEIEVFIRHAMNSTGRITTSGTDQS
jgi:AcrR family transcriptional regulator